MSGRPISAPGSAATTAGAATPTPPGAVGRDADRTYAKIARRIVPLALAGYIVAYIDRVNVGFAKLQFVQDLGFSEAVYGFGAGLFFIGYMLFEIPSNLYLERAGARATLTRIMVLWGAMSAGTALISSPTQYYVMRFLLGAAEAGFFPGIILYLSYWFPAARRGRITSLFTMGGTIAGVIGSPLSGWLLTLDGLHGLRGWQIVFIYEGLPAIGLGLLAYCYMDDRPSEAKWLTADEKALVAEAQRAISGGGARRHARLGHAFRDPTTYALAVAYVAVISGTSTVALWAPTLLKEFGVRPTLNGLLLALPFAVAVLGMFFLSRSSDRRLERRWHYAVAIGAAGLGLSLLSVASGSLVLTMALLTVAATGAWASLPVFWTIPTAYLSEQSRAGGIAFISSVGAIGGFVSPVIVGWVTTATGTLYAGLAAIGAILVASAVLLLAGVGRGQLREGAAGRG
jgi:ACS family phthalate transporter-like MFS transporter